MSATLKLAERRSTLREAIKPKDTGSDLVWTGADYPLLQPGTYLVRGAKIQKPEWLKRYRRWAMRIEFDLVNESGNVSAFFNMGNDPERAKPGGRQSNYWKAWTLANNDPPRKNEKMAPERFLEGQFFRVRVDSVKQRDNGNPKPESEIYSIITEFLSAEWP